MTSMTFAESEPDDPAVAARVELADAMRRITHAIVGRSHDASHLRALAARLSADADELERGPERFKEMKRWTDPEAYLYVPDDGHEFANAPDRPVSGFGNPWSVPLRVMRDGDRAVTTVTLGRGHEGPPMRCHGGVVAAIYDDLLGYLTVLHLAFIPL